MKNKKVFKPLGREEALKDNSSMNAPFAFKIENNGVETVLIFDNKKGENIIERETKDI